MPQTRFAIAGQTFPEPSPYDRLILDRHLRFSGDAVAIIAAETEKAALKAMKLIRVNYQVLPAVLDFRTAKDNPVLVHPEEDWFPPCDVGGDPKRNLVASDSETYGDVDGILADCDIVLERTYHTKAFNQAMMEPFTTYADFDRYGRLHIISSTQIVFHTRRILSRALGIPKSKIRVEKPRIGGGFGAKQTAVCEVYPAFVAMKTGRPAMICYTREEAQIAGSPRHEMEITVKLGATKEGKIRVMDLYTLSNSGAYGEHGPTTVGLSGHKSIPLYTGSLEAHRFGYDVVYTNHQAAGAYRGYGATQGIFAVESIVSELAEQLGMDATEIRDKNMIREGMVMPAYYNEIANACALDRCMEHCRKMFNWEERSKVRDMGNGKVRTAGVAMAMQGSSIAGVDVGGADIKLNEDGSYTLALGCTDMGTGCDTILAQMAADCLETSMENIVVFSVDTDISPYDSGSYASSTTYTTGMAVIKACAALREKICELGAEMLETEKEKVDFDGSFVYCTEEEEKKVSLEQVALKSTFFNNIELQAVKEHSSPISPPPFMVGMAEVEVDKETGTVELLDYVAVVDCGTPINPNLARVQTEGGIAQGVGMALFEDVQYTDKGKIRNNSFMQYKIPTREDIGNIRVDFESSYEPSGPFGAKSIGELVIDTPCPAIAEAVYNATGVRVRELPITPEKVAMGILKKELEK